VKEPRVKEEEMEMLAPEEDERPWWVKERNLQNAARHPDDPEDAPGVHVLARSYAQAQPIADARAAAWLVQDSSNVVDLTKDNVVDGSKATAAPSFISILYF
jgi:hypothetical protein